MKRLIFFFSFLVLVSLGGVFFWWSQVSQPPSHLAEQKRFLIPKGQSAATVGERLEQEGVIKNSLAFKLYLQFRGKTAKIQAGEYLLSRDLTLQRVVASLLLGPKELWVTYPEGLRREEVALRTIKVLGLEQKEAQIFWEEFLEETAGVEGFLFPDTYLFPRDVSAERVTRKLRSTFDEKVTDEMITDAGDAGLSLEQVVNIASIVERETLTEDERPIVAGILLKRLRADWPLETDASVQYVLGSQRCSGDRLPVLDCDWWKQTTLEDRKVKSTYNTYGRVGLPYAPVANPGLSSIKAVVYPESSPYWFYLHDSKGDIHYAQTAQEHAQNVVRYIK